MQFWELDRQQVDSHQPQVLRDEGDGIRLIAVDLSQGESLPRHPAHQHALLLLTRGLVRLGSVPNERMLSSPSLIHFAPGEQHVVCALSECHLVLSLTTPSLPAA
jgi:quercetin dioxygenase-like cupin family protein